MKLSEEDILYGDPTPKQVLDFYDLHTAEGAVNFSNADAGLPVLLWHALSHAMSIVEACRLYLKTGTPFARAALERALEELE